MIGSAVSPATLYTTTKTKGIHGTKENVIKEAFGKPIRHSTSDTHRRIKMAGSAPTHQSQCLRKGQNLQIEAPNERDLATAHVSHGKSTHRHGGCTISIRHGHDALLAMPSQPPPPPQKKHPTAPANPFELRPVQKAKQAALSTHLAEIEAEASQLRRQKEMRNWMIADEIEEVELVDKDEDEDSEVGAYNEGLHSGQDLFSPIRLARTHGYDGEQLSLRRQHLEVGKKDLQRAR